MRYVIWNRTDIEIKVVKPIVWWWFSDIYHLLFRRKLYQIPNVLNVSKIQLKVFGDDGEQNMWRLWENVRNCANQKPQGMSNKNDLVLNKIVFDISNKKIN